MTAQEVKEQLGIDVNDYEEKPLNVTEHIGKHILIRYGGGEFVGKDYALGFVIKDGHLPCMLSNDFDPMTSRFQRRMSYTGYAAWGQSGISHYSFLITVLDV